MAFVTGGTNRSLSSKPPADYLAQTLAEQGREALATHGIPTDPSLWTIEAYPSFLEYRLAELARALNRFIEGEGTAAPAISRQSWTARATPSSSRPRLGGTTGRGRRTRPSKRSSPRLRVVTAEESRKLRSALL